MTSGPVERARIEQLRERIARADRSLVAAYLARRRLVRELLAYKAALGVEPYDRDQEARVVARARSWAVDLGAPPREAEELIAWVLRQNQLGRDARRPIAVPVGSR